MTMISQDLFDETLLENQDVFDYTDDEALKETIDEFIQQQQQQQRQHRQLLDHVSLTHPGSMRGKRDRELQKKFVNSLSQDAIDIAVATSILKELHQTKQQKQSPTTEADDNGNDNDNDNGNDNANNHNNDRILLSLWYLMLQNNLWTNVAVVFPASSSLSSPIVDFVVALFPPSSLSYHPLGNDLKQIISPYWFENNDDRNAVQTHVTVVGVLWYRLLEESLLAAEDNNSSIPLSLVELAFNLCNGCESNKKSCVQAGLTYQQNINDRDKNITGLELLVSCLEYCRGRTKRRKSNDDDDDDNDDESSLLLVARETCRLIAVLGKFQPLAESMSSTGGGGGGGNDSPLVSSAHANVKEFQKIGVLPQLHRIATGCMEGLREGVTSTIDPTTDGNRKNSFDNHYHRQELLCESLSALRSMAIDNDIVQNMIALGVLDIVCNSLETLVQASTIESRSSLLLSLATATFGLVRNLCANDEVKTTICKSSLSCILQIMQHYDDNKKEVLPLESSSSSSLCELVQLNHLTSNRRTATSATKRGRRTAILQEHACGILGAMALRQPQNAHDIVEDDGHILILRAMRAYPNKITLQRQGCLALRNIVSRQQNHKSKLLDANADDVLLKIAGIHPESSEEAYAALRDLGLNPDIFKVDEYGNTTRSTTETFGTVQSSFRPIYE